ncbi:MAG: UDP-N-acetylmuramate dehydrogenase [Bacteroidia bacterium]
MNIQKGTSLFGLNTFGMKATIAQLAKATSLEDVQSILEYQYKNKMPLFILGGGSNILFTKDVEALVLLNRLKGISVREQNEDYVWVEACAGENWHQFVQHCIQQNWGGMENLSLIPGNVGASPMQNIGAYGVEIKDVFHSLEAVRLRDGQVREFSAEECRFGYRESIFKQEEKGNWLISKVTYRLTRKNHVLKTEYGAILSELEKMKITHPDIQSISKAVIQIRQSKLPDPAEIGNAGSFFKNPVIELELLENIKLNHPDCVNYPAGEGKVKLAAGWLIEKAGWKGYRKGDAGVHKNQALVLVNYGHAKGDEIASLADQIIEDILIKFGVKLEKEVNIY